MYCPLNWIYFIAICNIIFEHLKFDLNETESYIFFFLFFFLLKICIILLVCYFHFLSPFLNISWKKEMLCYQYIMSFWYWVCWVTCLIVEQWKGWHYFKDIMNFYLFPPVVYVEQQIFKTNGSLSRNITNIYILCNIVTTY